MKCKKCLHYEVCVKLGKPSLYGINQEIGCSAYKDKEKWEEKKDTITNADLIRAMSVEELADWMYNGISTDPCDYCEYNNGHCDGSPCRGKADAETIIEWLKQPSE